MYDRPDEVALGLEGTGLGDVSVIVRELGIVLAREGRSNRVLVHLFLRILTRPIPRVGAVVAACALFALYGLPPRSSMSPALPVTRRFAENVYATIQRGW